LDLLIWETYSASLFKIGCSTKVSTHAWKLAAVWPLQFQRAQQTNNHSCWSTHFYELCSEGYLKLLDMFHIIQTINTCFHRGTCRWDHVTLYSKTNEKWRFLRLGKFIIVYKFRWEMFPKSKLELCLNCVKIANVALVIHARRYNLVPILWLVLCF
jgi:ferredoxin-like protein FixX